jgi:hypothetical protein
LLRDRFQQLILFRCEERTVDFGIAFSSLIRRVGLALSATYPRSSARYPSDDPDIAKPAAE